MHGAVVHLADESPDVEPILPSVWPASLDDDIGRFGHGFAGWRGRRLLGFRVTPAVMGGVASVITEELRKEDRLNEEVRDVLVEHSDEMSRSNITYNEMFKMVKRRLAKEKGIVL